MNYIKCQQCNEKVYGDEYVFVFEDEMFCSDSCVKDSIESEIQMIKLCNLTVGVDQE
jgi:hypothetical protein